MNNDNFFNTEAEIICLIGIFLEAKREKLPLAVLNFLKPSDFYDPINASIYQAITNIAQKTNPTGDIVYVLLTEMLTEAERMRALEAIRSMNDIYPTALGTNVEAIARRIKFYSLKRDFYLKLRDKRKLPPDEELFDSIEQDFLRVKAEIMDMETKSNTSVSEILSEDSQSEPVLLCQYPTLKTLIDDFRPSQLYILAGMTSIGKTTFSLSLVETSYIHRVPLLYISSEIDRRTLLDRFICMHTKIDYDKYRRDYLSAEERERFSIALGEVEEMPLYISDDALTLERIEQFILYHISHYGIKFVIIDFIQHLNSKAKRWNTRDEELTYIIRRLKMFAVKNKIAMFVVSQLSRKPDSRGKKRRPRLSDLRESGSLEQNADVVMFLHRPDEEDKNKVELIVAKNRWGKTGIVNFYIDYATGEIGEMTFEEEEEEDFIPF